MSLPVYLSDFSHEADAHEAAVFYFFYLAIELYIVTSCIALLVLLFVPPDATYWEKSFAFAGLLIFMPSIFPCIFCSILSIMILIKKKITETKIIVLTIVLMVLNYFLFNYLGMVIGTLIPMLLMTLADNSVEQYDKILKLQQAEHDRKIEAQLEKEKIIKEMHKDEDRSETLIHIELTRDEYDEKNKFRLFD